MINNLNKNKINNILEVSVSLREILLFTLFTSIITGLMSVLYSQNLQIQRLITALESLQASHDALVGAVEELKVVLTAKEIELAKLKAMVSELNTIESSSIAAPLDAELVRAQTERQMLYVKIAVGALAVFVLLGGGLWVFKGATTFFSLKAWLPTGALNLAQKVGFLKESVKYHQLHHGNYWVVEVINGTDITIKVKTPGSGSFTDAMDMLVDAMQKMPTQVPISDTAVITANVTSETVPLPNIDLSLILPML